MDFFMSDNLVIKWRTPIVVDQITYPLTSNPRHLEIAMKCACNKAKILRSQLTPLVKCALVFIEAKISLPIRE